MLQDLNNNTICAPATAAGQGAIAVIRVSGPDALDIVSKIFVSPTGRKLADMKGYTMCYGSVMKGVGEVLDDVVLSVYRAPESYTGEDMVEISSHASPYIVSEILDLLVSFGCRFADPGEFTKRAFLNGKMDLAQAEAVADVIASETEASHRIAIQQLKGGFSKELAAMRKQLLKLVSLMELELDFSEEDVEFADRSELKTLLEAIHVISYASTSGFGISDNGVWPSLPSALLVFVGIWCGMAGSTTGGLKSDRALLLCKEVHYRLKTVLHPASVSEVRINKRVIRQEDIAPHILYIALYMMLIIISLAINLAVNPGNSNAIAATFTSLSNVGPAIRDLGVFGNFGAEPTGAKLIYTFDMFLGRVEIYPVLAVLMMITGKTAK